MVFPYPMDPMMVFPYQWSRKMKIIRRAKPDEHDNVLALYPDAKLARKLIILK